MLTLPSSVKIYVAVQPVDARKSFDGLAGMVQSEFELEPTCGHLFAFVNRRGHIAQLLFWDRNGFCLVKKRLESGTFRLARKPEPGATHVQIDSGELTLLLEGFDLQGAKRRKRYRQLPD